MFLGSYKPSFDQTSKRLALPIQIRDYLATSKIILSYGFEKCIFGFDTEAWEKESAKQLAKSVTDSAARTNRRFFFASARFVDIDSQGRIVIPSGLLEYAQIREPLIIGAGDHFEIWDQRNWQGILKTLEEASK